MMWHCKECNFKSLDPIAFEEHQKGHAVRQHHEEPKQDFGHTTSSVKPRFGLIPHAALVALADRFELGEKKHAEKAWNALSSQIGLENEAWVISRVEHVIHHAYQYLQKLKGFIPDDGDDDAAGIMWGGSLLYEAKRVRDASKKNKV
ncbi:MAG TPA: hypothetical protein VNX68_02290 [Nitrosopumilaceae archaeon]|jgi:hypothetical protein|nr:hypothetical protein [Nitrosopumilaceae archaeon]